MRLFQAVFFILVVTVYGLLALASLWWFARDALSPIFQAVKTRGQVITKHWRIKPDWRLGGRRKSVQQAPKSSFAPAPNNFRIPPAETSGLG